MATFSRTGATVASVIPGQGNGTDLIVLQLGGDLATPDEPQLRGAYAKALQVAADVRLNFAGVEHINSSGISVPINLLRDCQEHGQRLSFSGLTPHYAKVFTFMGLTQCAPIVHGGADVPGATSGVLGDRGAAGSRASRPTRGASRKQQLGAC